MCRSAPTGTSDARKDATTWSTGNRRQRGREMGRGGAKHGRVGVHAGACVRACHHRAQTNRRPTTNWRDGPNQRGRHVITPCKGLSYDQRTCISDCKHARNYRISHQVHSRGALTRATTTPSPTTTHRKPAVLHLDLYRMPGVTMWAWVWREMGVAVWVRG